MEEDTFYLTYKHSPVSQSAFAGYGLEAFNYNKRWQFKLGSQSAFAGYGLEGNENYNKALKDNPVAIRFRWIWVGSDMNLELTTMDLGWSQSAFAGYGLEANFNVVYELQNTSQSAFAGYGLEGKSHYQATLKRIKSRNPLSLDMGWKKTIKQPRINQNPVAIRFRWIWVGRKIITNLTGNTFPSRNPLSLDMGWKCRHIFRECHENCRNPLSLDMGWKQDFDVVPANRNFRCRNPLSLDMGWKQVSLCVEHL